MDPSSYNSIMQIVKKIIPDEAFVDKNNNPLEKEATRQHRIFPIIENKKIRFIFKKDMPADFITKIFIEFPKEWGEWSKHSLYPLNAINNVTNDHGNKLEYEIINKRFLNIKMDEIINIKKDDVSFTINISLNPDNKLYSILYPIKSLSSDVISHISSILGEFYNAPIPKCYVESVITSYNESPMINPDYSDGEVKIEGDIFETKLYSNRVDSNGILYFVYEKFINIISIELSEAVQWVYRKEDLIDLNYFNTFNTLKIPNNIIYTHFPSQLYMKIKPLDNTSSSQPHLIIKYFVPQKSIRSYLDYAYNTSYINTFVKSIYTDDFNQLNFIGCCYRIVGILCDKKTRLPIKSDKKLFNSIKLNQISDRNYGFTFNVEEDQGIVHAMNGIEDLDEKLNAFSYVFQKPPPFSNRSIGGMNRTMSFSRESSIEINWVDGCNSSNNQIYLLNLIFFYSNMTNDFGARRYLY